MTADHATGLLSYFARRRRDAIQKYKQARLWVERKDARAWALHYGRLIRMFSDTKGLT